MKIETTLGTLRFLCTTCDTLFETPINVLSFDTEKGTVIVTIDTKMLARAAEQTACPHVLIVAT